MDKKKFLSEVRLTEEELTECVKKGYESESYDIDLGIDKLVAETQLQKILDHRRIKVLYKDDDGLYKPVIFPKEWGTMEDKNVR